MTLMIFHNKPTTKYHIEKFNSVSQSKKWEVWVTICVKMCFFLDINLASPTAEHLNKWDQPSLY